MVKYASETGTSAAVRKFRPDFPKIKESTIREFKKKCEEEFKLAKQQIREVRTELSTEKQGRPLLLGTKIDTLVQRYIRAASNRGAIITRSIVKSAAKALLIRYPNEIGKINLDDSEYGKSLLQRMNYTRWKATTSKVKLPGGIRKESELLFHHQIVEKVEKYDIPDSLIVNFDQTPSKYVPVASATLAKQNSKQVSIKGSDDKRSITATFTITMDGKFLGMQLIYGGKTNQSLPRYQFPKNFYSNEKESLKLFDEIILPYVNLERQRLLKPNQQAIGIFDVFRGQITDDVLTQYKDNNIEVVSAPANMTGLLQPLDLTVKSKFNHWYMSEFTKQMDDGKSVEEVDVKLQLTRLKPLHVEWLTELYNHMTTQEGKDFIMSGWKAAGILQAIRTGSANLERLDPFSDIDPLLSEVTHENNINRAEINEEEREAFINPARDYYSESDSDSDDDVYAPEDDHRNVFNIFEDNEL